MTDPVHLNATEKTLFRQSVDDFIGKEVAPFYEEWERAGIYPGDVWHKLGENGFLCVDTPSRYNGYDASFELSCIIVEQISRAGLAALATGILVHSDIAAPYLLHLGSEEQKLQWIPKMVSGEVVVAIGMTEPAAGSDLQGIQTTAGRDGDDFRNHERVDCTQYPRKVSHRSHFTKRVETDINLSWRKTKENYYEL